MVIATQNPVEHHGTYPLPESQLDRFLMRLRIGYPEPRASAKSSVSRKPHHGAARPAFSAARNWCSCRSAVAAVTVDEALVDYMLAIVERTRTHESLALGVSPRGSQALYRAVAGAGAVEGRDYVLPDDVKRAGGAGIRRIA